MADSPLSPVALRHHRERTIAQLCEHFAQDHLETNELEQLIDRAHQATTISQLDELVNGLPALHTPTPADPSTVPDPAGPRRDQQLVVAVMGGAERKGRWKPARNTHVVAFMGGVCLDFRHATLERGVTEVTVVAIMGGVEVIVPPGVHVESNGVGIAGGFAHSGDGRFPVDSSVPVLRITGLAFLGGVDIREHPSDSPPGRERESHRQLREERHRLRRETRDARRESSDDSRRLGRGE